MTNLRAVTNVCLRSRACQFAGVATMFLLVAFLHRQSDGLWFQGDAPRHAANGFFWWDLLRATPRDPVAFAISYYARYPVIAPATYPPLFYLFEGLAFALLGPSPYVAKLLVVGFAVVIGLYTAAWARRWIHVRAGWAGAFLAVLPGIVLWSNSVMLNVPATACGVAALYHGRCWLESGRGRQLAATVGFAMAVLLIYYPGGVVLCVLAAWVLPRVRGIRFDRTLLWLAVAALVAVVPLFAALLLAPVHTSRQLPTMAFLTSGATWLFYWRVLPGLVGRAAFALGAAGFAAIVWRPWRGEAAYVSSWLLVLIFTLSLLPARDARYVLLAAPAITLAAAISIAAAAEHLPPVPSEWQAAALAAGLMIGLWSAARVQVPQVSGFRELAAFLQERAPADAVLYDGSYGGLFGFYVRASDPRFERRLVLAERFLYEWGPTTSFAWVQKSNVASTDDVVNLVRTRSGCRYVAIEVDTTSHLPEGARLLREAVTRSEFEFVRSFPILGSGERRVDLYKAVVDVNPIATVDLSFPSLSHRTFAHVVPITR